MTQIIEQGSYIYLHENGDCEIFFKENKASVYLSHRELAKLEILLKKFNELKNG